MNTLNLKFTNALNMENLQIKIDDSRIKLKSNEFKNLQGTYKTDKDRARITIFKPLDTGGKLWFFVQIFFFIISIFGIFDIHRRDKCLGLVYDAEVDLAENGSMTLTCNAPKADSKAFAVSTNLQVNELENAYYVDEKAKKTRKLLLVSKIITAIIIVAIVIIVLAATL